MGLPAEIHFPQTYRAASGAKHRTALQILSGYVACEYSSRISHVVVIDDCGTGEGAARLIRGRFPYAEGGREKYSTSTGVPKKIFWKLEPVVCRASVTMVYGVPGKMARTIAGSSINPVVALCPGL